MAAKSKSQSKSESKSKSSNTKSPSGGGSSNTTSFTGTHTGSKYEVGRVYENSRGGLSVANSNGTFTDLETGRTSAGSYYGNGKASFSSTGGAGSATERTATPRQVTQTSGPAAGQVIRGGQVVTVGPGVPRATQKGAAIGGTLKIAQNAPKPGQVVKHKGGYTDHQIPISEEYAIRFDGPVPQADPKLTGGRPLPFLGIPWEMSPNVPSGQVIEDEFGEADVTNPQAFAANSVAAIGNFHWNWARLEDYVARNAIINPINNIGRSFQTFGEGHQGSSPFNPDANWGK